MLSYKLPEVVEHGGADLIRIASYVTALIVVGSFAFHKRSPLRKLFGWLFLRNVSGPFWEKWDASFERNTLRTVVPMLDAVKKAAKEQHDEQNGKLDSIGSSVEQLGERVTAVEEVVTNPPSRTTRTRQGD